MTLFLADGSNWFYQAGVWLSAETGLGSVLSFTLLILVGAAFLAFGFVAPYATMAVWAERRVAGRIQARVGPNRVGWFGLLQSLADGVKLISKEDIVPTGSDKFFFKLCPMIVFGATFATFAALPFAPYGTQGGIVIADLNIGLLYVLSIGSLTTIGVILAGWSSNSKWSLYGSIREAAQVVSYEIPLGISALVPVLAFGTLSLTQICQMQMPDMANLSFQDSLVSILSWGAFRSPFGFVAMFIFFTAAMANNNRAPFDLAEAESELVSGFHTEYSGMRWGMFFLAEYASMYMVSALCGILFLGGWSLWILDPVVLPLLNSIFGTVLGPILLGVTAISVKALAGVMFMIWLRWTLPRFRIDQVIDLCYKYLLPWSLVCLMGQAAWNLWAAPVFTIIFE